MDYTSILGPSFEVISTRRLLLYNDAIKMRLAGAAGAGER